MISPEFLDLEEVLEIHALQLDEFGGIAGVRDRGLLESAVEQPRAAEGRADKQQLADQLRKLADEAQA
ncbi:MAG TPA: Fic family protein [Polyangiaceae bacterium]|nr:Fic family protein [Polyangiaceae bacterium]